MSFQEVLQSIRNLFSFSFSSSSTKENQLKRRADLTDCVGSPKQRKLNSNLSKIIDRPFEENIRLGHSRYPNELSMSQIKNENNFYNRRMLPSPTSRKKTTYIDHEFSDDNDDVDDDNDDVVYIHNDMLSSHKLNQRNSQARRSYIGAVGTASESSSSNYNKRRQILSEENYRRDPIIYNVPIQIETATATRRSKPPPLVDVKTGDLLRATCVLPISKPSMSPFNNSSAQKPKIKNRIGNGYGTTLPIPDLKEIPNKNCKLNDNHYKNSIFRGSWISKAFNLSDREEYLKLLTKTMPSLYTTKIDYTKENERHKLAVKTITTNTAAATNNSSGAIIDLTKSNLNGDDEGAVGVDDDKPIEFIDLSNDDIKIISHYEKYNENESLSSVSSRKKKELPIIEPVNSFQEKLNLQPILHDGWLATFKNRYAVKHLNRKKEILEEEENARKLSEGTAKQEKLIRERLKNIVIDTETIILDEPEPIEKEVEFPEFTDEDVELIQNAMYGASNQPLIQKFNLTITRNDIKTLVGSNWLNDEVINFYMNLIAERSEKRSNCGYPSVYAMNTFFIPRFTQSGYSGIRRWTRKVDIFKYDIIIIPVHVGGVHWCMSIIHLKNKTIKYYDSMGTPNLKLLNMLEQYLKDESLDKRNQPFNTSNFVKESVMDIPRQMNGSDCGVFSCMFAEYVCRNKEITFTQQHMEYFRQKMVLEIVKGELML